MTAEVELDGMLRRLHMPTVRRLWSDLQVRAEQEGMRYADYLQALVGEEIAHRTQTRISRMTHRARFPFLRTIEEFDFAYQSGLRKELLGSYLGPEFVLEGRSLLLYGPSGVGKTHVAIAIAYKAIQHGSDARFVTAAHLIDELSSASRDGKLREALAPYTHPGVLVVDEVGYLSYGPDAANVLFQVVNERHLHRRPMVFTTNKPIEVWGKVLHDPDLAEAILDRVLERGRVLHFKGPSFRTRHLQSKEGARISGKGGPEFQEPTNSAPPQNSPISGARSPTSRDWVNFPIGASHVSLLTANAAGKASPPSPSVRRFDPSLSSAAERWKPTPRTTRAKGPPAPSYAAGRWACLKSRVSGRRARSRCVGGSWRGGFARLGRSGRRTELSHSRPPLGCPAARNRDHLTTGRCRVVRGAGPPIGWSLTTDQG